MKKKGASTSCPVIFIQCFPAFFYSRFYVFEGFQVTWLFLSVRKTPTQDACMNFLRPMEVLRCSGPPSRSASSSLNVPAWRNGISGLGSVRNKILIFWRGQVLSASGIYYLMKEEVQATTLNHRETVLICTMKYAVAAIHSYVLNLKNYVE